MPNDKFIACTVVISLLVPTGMTFPLRLAGENNRKQTTVVNPLQSDFITFINKRQGNINKINQLIILIYLHLGI